MAVDPYAGAVPAFGTTPYIGGFAITPGTALPRLTRALYVGGAGNVNLTMNDGSTFVLTGVPAGTLLPLSVSAVASASTTAAALLGLY